MHAQLSTPFPFSSLNLRGYSAICGALSLSPSGRLSAMTSEEVEWWPAAQLSSLSLQGHQMAKFEPFLSLDCAWVEGVGAQSKERKGSNFAAQRSGAIVPQARRAKLLKSKNLAIAIWQP